MRVGGVDFRVVPEGDGGEDEVAEREAMTRARASTTETRGFDPVLPLRVEATGAAKERRNVAGVRLAGDALQDLGGDGADKSGAVVVKKGIHRSLFRRVRAVEEGNPDAGVNEDQSHRSPQLRGHANCRPWRPGR